MADISKVKDAVGGDWAQAALWGLVFTCLCVLVGLGKIKSEVVELMLMAIIGRAASHRLPRDTSKKDDNNAPPGS